MKIREGFVSNSSSTCYLVAFVPEENDLNLKTFDFLLSKIDNKNIKLARTTVECRKETVGEEIKNLQECKQWIDGYVCILKECAKDNKSKIIFNELNDYWGSKHKVEFHSYKYGKECLNIQDTLTSKIKHYEEDLMKLEKEITALNGQLEKIKDLPDETVIASWEEDHWEGFFCGLVDMLVADGRVKILEKVGT